MTASDTNEPVRREKVAGRVLLVTDEFPPDVGGIAQMLGQMARQFEQGRLRVLFGHRGRGAPPVSEPGDIALVRFPRGRDFDTAWSVVRMAMRVWRELRTGQFGVVLIAKVWPLGLVAIIPRLLGIPYVVQTYGNDFFISRGPLSRMGVAAILKRARRVLTISRFSRDRLIGIGVRPENVSLVFPKVDVAAFEWSGDAESFRRSEGLVEYRVLLTVARLVERKGIDRVLQALPLIARQFPNVLYVVLGMGEDEDRLRAVALQAGVLDRVRFVGDRDPVPFYHACDVFVMTSREIAASGDAEGFGIVYLEAGACHKPVIAGRSGGVPDAVVDGRSGILVDPNDVRAIADAVCRLLADEPRRRELGEYAYARVRGEFDVSLYARDLADIVS